MTTVYRAHSPSRDSASSPTDSRPYAVGVAATRNQHALTDTSLPADWAVQTGHVQWETQ